MAARFIRRLFDVGKSGGATAFAGVETRPPADQNAVDLVPGWSCHFPTEFPVAAGAIPAFADPRIAWAIERFGDLSGRRALELGPLEGGHTYMLTQAGASVDAVEGNSLAYFKCLIAREIIGFQNARFFLGDFVKWLEQTDCRYDYIVGSGVLYHMREPLRLLEAIANRTDTLYLWTVIVDDNDLTPTARVAFRGETIRLYARGYGDRSVKFCGGPEDFPMWTHRDDLIKALTALGFSSIEIAHDVKHNPGNRLPTYSVFARRGEA